MPHRFTIRLAGLCVATVVIGAGLVLITPAILGNESVASAQVTPLDEEPEETPGLGDITGSPEAGPDPEDAGDRGGVAQLTLAIVLIGAVGFIGTKLVLATRANDM